MNATTPNHLARLTVKYLRATEAPIRIHTILREMVKPTPAGVGFPGLFFCLVQVLYFAVLGLVPCPLGIFWVLQGPIPLLHRPTYTTGETHSTALKDRNCNPITDAWVIPDRLVARYSQRRAKGAACPHTG